MYSSTLNKSELRKLYLKERMTFSKEEIEDYSQTIFESFLKFFDLSEVKKVHCFLPIEKFNEINTFLFIHYFWENNIEVYVPKIIGEEMISIKLEKSTELIKNSWGILEPKSNLYLSENNFDLVITPLLYCDKNGNRIGYGKGFYDKFFKKLNLETVKIGLNFFTPIQQISDISDFDEKLDYLVTPTEILSFFDGISKFTK
ncbi:5-formyltetrahydrofolate cyclo-ligase [Halpernia sp.]|uniref:5-formyltetrahydrofolate cyclo-ligase n=1 Tax=Halpernia sp. TaxID=2782209 RepID=UPI003A8F5CB1